VQVLLLPAGRLPPLHPQCALRPLRWWWGREGHSSSSSSYGHHMVATMNDLPISNLNYGVGWGTWGEGGGLWGRKGNYGRGRGTMGEEGELWAREGHYGWPSRHIFLAAKYFNWHTTLFCREHLLPGGAEPEPPARHQLSVAPPGQASLPPSARPAARGRQTMVKPPSPAHAGLLHHGPSQVKCYLQCIPM
jgi:hypothetical protein